MHTVKHVDVATLGGLFGELKDLLEKSLTHTPEWSLEDVVEDLIDENSHLFTIDDGNSFKGVAVARVEKHPQKEYLLIHMLGGDGIKDWLEELRGAMRMYAEALGLDGVRIYGRQGWQKLFPDLKCERIILTDKVGE